MILSYCGLPESDSSSCFTTMSHVKSQTAPHVLQDVANAESSALATAMTAGHSFLFFLPMHFRMLKLPLELNLLLHLFHA